MEYNDWDISSIVHSCKATTFTNVPTIFGASSQPENLTNVSNTTTPSCYNHFTFHHENNSVPFAPLIPNNIIDLNNMMTNFNSTTHITTPSTAPINTPSTTTISTYITPNIITNIDTNVQVSNQNSTFFDFSTFIEKQQMQPNEFTEKELFLPKFNPLASISTPETPMLTSSITTPTTTNYTTITPITTTTTFATPVSTINTQTTTPRHLLQQKHKSSKRKNENHVTSVCTMKADELSEDPWQWRKYGKKPIKGSPYPRNYYKCSTFRDPYCPARKLVDQSTTEENTYVVRYLGKHTHPKPAVKKNFGDGTSQNKSSEAGVVGSSRNVENIDSHNMATLQCDDELERSNAQVFASESEIPYSKTDFIESANDGEDDDILIPNITAMSEEYLLDFNYLNGGALFP